MGAGGTNLEEIYMKNYCLEINNVLEKIIKM